MTILPHFPNVYRQSHYILVFRLILIEIILAGLYLVIRIPKTYLLSPSVSSSSSDFLNAAGFIYFLFLSLIELFLVVHTVLRWANEIYVVRGDSILHRRGIFTMKEDNITLQNMGSATIEQGILGKMLHYGTISVYSPVLKQEFKIENIPHPEQLVQTLYGQMESQSEKNSIIRKPS